MTAPDPGLIELLAAHRWTCSRDEDCICGWVGPFADFPTHVALVAEQHTNRRMAELEAENRHLENNLDVARMGRAAAEARVAELEARMRVDDDRS